MVKVRRSMGSRIGPGREKGEPKESIDRYRRLAASPYRKKKILRVLRLLISRPAFETGDRGCRSTGEKKGGRRRSKHEAKRKDRREE